MAGNTPVMDTRLGMQLQHKHADIWAAITSSTTGSSGTSGRTGTSGSSGTSGINGTSGLTGSSGTSGLDGTSGIDGTSGTSGSAGTSGLEGTSGTSGLDGTSGTNGADGSSGTSGIDGTSGTNGTAGTSGTSGAAGLWSKTATTVHPTDATTDLLGVGTTAAADKIHTYGTDTTEGDGWNLQQNGVMLDGVAGADKDIVWANAGVAKWYAQIYRGESGSYWYLGAQEPKQIPLTVSHGGRIGFNKATNFLDYHASMTTGTPGTGDDIEVGGTYEKNFVAIYEVNVLSNGTPDRMRWRRSLDGGVIYSTPYIEFDATTAPYELENGVTVAFGSTTGHVVANVWRFAAYPQLPQGTVTINPVKLDEVQTTVDYTAEPPVFIDRTADANSSMLDKVLTFFVNGSTAGSMYIGTVSKENSLFFNLSTVGTATGRFKVQYYKLTAPSTYSWVDIDTSMDFYDETVNLSKSGRMRWSPSLMTGWTNTADVIHPSAEEDSYKLYWLRLICTTPYTTAPIASCLTRHGDRRFAVYTGASDYNPSWYIDSLGRTSIGGGNITGNNMLQISSKSTTTLTNLATSAASTTSVFEIDSESGSFSDMLFRMSAGTDASPDSAAGFMLGRSRGTLAVPTSVYVTATTQLVTFSILPTAGAFTLVFPLGTTASLNYNASSASVQTAIRNLGAAYNATTVSGNTTSGFIIAFIGAPVVALATVGANTLTGAGSAPVTITPTLTAAGGTPDALGYLVFKGYVNTTWRDLAYVKGLYTGTAFARQAALSFMVAEGAEPIEKMRITTSGVNLAAGVAINEFSSDGTMAGDSDTAVPTEKAVKAYVASTATKVPGTTAKNYNSDGTVGDRNYNGGYIYECITTGTGGTGRWVRYVAETSGF